MAKTIKFYTKKEVARLKEVLGIPTKKDRRASLMSFCTEFKRPFTGAYAKMKNLKAVPASGRTKTPTARISDHTTVIPFKSFRVEFSPTPQLVITY